MTQFVRPNHLIPEDQLACWIAQIALGLDYLHNQANIIHRDIKLQNILVMKNGLLKLADFGISRKLFPEEFAKTSLGTPYNLAPEIVEHSKYDYKADIWSFGCMLSELCCSEKPFYGKSVK
jgi:serine/threonine protein kinase